MFHPYWAPNHFWQLTWAYVSSVPSILATWQPGWQSSLIQYDPEITRYCIYVYIYIFLYKDQVSKVTTKGHLKMKKPQILWDSICPAGNRKTIGSWIWPPIFGPSSTRVNIESTESRWLFFHHPATVKLKVLPGNLCNKAQVMIIPGHASIVLLGHMASQSQWISTPCQIVRVFAVRMILIYFCLFIYIYHIYIYVMS